MSRASDLFRARLQRRAASMSVTVRADILRAYAQIKKALGDAMLTKLIESGLLDRVLSETNLARAFVGLQRTIRDGVEAANRLLARDLPGAAAGVAFDTLSPQVITAIRALNDRAIQALASDIREGVRVYVERGLREGINPREIARGLRDVIGLAPNQVDAVANFRGLLEARDADALSRELRDHRFDAQIRKAFAGDGLTPAQIDRMVDRYQSRFVAFNAETNARTIALDAQRLGQHLTWAAAVERGDINGDRLTKRWSGTLDDRERETHLAMEGETVPWDEEYSNGQMIPGEDEYNCRCVSIYETSGTPQEGAGARGVDLDRLVGATS